jgi:DNA-binding NarL/FixJ family response regulator
MTYAVNGKTALSIMSNSYLLREGLATLLEKYLPIELVGTYTGEVAPDASLPNPPGHVVLLDGGIGRELALSWTRFWRACATPARVVLLELANDIEMILACIEAGASGYTLQGALAADVAAVLQQAQKGQALCSPEVTAQIFARLEALARTQLSTPMPPMSDLPMPLTPREQEVLNCIAEGMSNKEIAAKLFIEIYTVKHHVHHILEKLELSHRREAVRVAVHHGWIHPQYDISRL